MFGLQAELLRWYRQPRDGAPRERRRRLSCSCWRRARADRPALFASAEAALSRVSRVRGRGARTRRPSRRRRLRQCSPTRRATSTC